jgi:hypothetical protein
MRTYRAKSGPFAKRPHFEPHEIDQICLSELRKHKMLPNEPGPIRIDRFIEKHFSIIPEYDDLPDGVLGYTKFGPNGVERIVVARILDEEGGVVAERRVRSTLAHEAGHGLLHAHLFALGDDGRELFDDDCQANHRILCRDEQGASKSAYDGRWWEYQANRMIGGLLVPTPLFRAALKPFLSSVGTLGAETIDDSRREAAARALANIFNVNPAVIRIRVDEAYPPQAGGQLSL